MGGTNRKSRSASPRAGKKTPAKVATKPSAPSTTPVAPAPSPFTRDDRLPAVGTVLQRAHRGKVLEVTVRENGFECGGKTYRSLSAIAREALGGTQVNGFLWFGLTRRPSAKSTPSPTAPASTPRRRKGTPAQAASVAKARAARAAKLAARKAEPTPS